MFTLDRYDPEVQIQTTKRGNESSRSNDASNKHRKTHLNDKKSSLRVIAHEYVAPVSTKLPQEALDDLDFIDEIINEGQSHSYEQSTEFLQVSQTDLDAALSFSEKSVVDAAKRWKLAPFLVTNLQRDGFNTFFPIQALAIPDVIASERHSHLRAQDICITAPTGSGKTLSYVLPILNALATKGGPRRLRSLVVLPSRDLATQVYNVFKKYVTGSTLEVGLAIGQSDFTSEQRMLTIDESSNDQNMLCNRLFHSPGDLELALRMFRDSSNKLSTTSSSNCYVPQNGWSNVDILVCTPGRLIDHLDNTPGFTLQHLLFLVVDEADRLLNQSYHNWIDRVIDASNQGSLNAWNTLKDEKLPSFSLHPNQSSIVLEPVTWRRSGTAGDKFDGFNTNKIDFAAKVCRQIQLRKFLVSATLTRDPQKLAALRLVNPKHFNVHQLHGENNRYAMPSSLEEYIVECTAEQKPMVLLSLILERLEIRHQGKKTVIVVFTSSLDSTHRLARLLQLLWCALNHTTDAVGEFSSALSQSERAALMKKCNDSSDNLSVIVCSDGMSRGMDLDFVDTVINYDVPTLAKTYVHRCGRTARASRTGTAISLLKGGQVGLFHRMRQLIQATERVQKMLVKKSLVSNTHEVYSRCIKALREVLDAETNGELGHREDVTDYIS